MLQYMFIVREAVVEMFHPKEVGHRSALMRVLQDGLRPDGAAFPIEAEYPLVLGQGNEAFSYCLGTSEKPLAHANLWPRRLIGGTPSADLRIGLVGNVVTHEQYRGQGLARELLEGLKQEATQRGLKALVLWSDLNGFYQKCGFSSCSEELRWLIQVPPLKHDSPSPQVLLQHEPSLELCAALLASRLSLGPTIERSAKEFQTLLRIPEVSLMTTQTTTPRAAATTFTIMGKGCDMIGVVHEWGAVDAFALVEQVRARGRRLGFSEVLLLTPARLPATWQEALHKQASQVQSHPMALAWCHDDAARRVLDHSFIWGLDSI